MYRARHIAVQSLAAIVLAVLILSVAGVSIVSSGWFRERVRARIVTEIETATGGQVELPNFNFDWTHLTATVAPLVLHGKEGENQPPLARFDSVTLGLRLISAVERRINLASLRLDKPAVHIIVYPDGSTNLPVPKRPATGDKEWPQTLIDLGVRHYEILHGTIEIDSRQTPLDVTGDDLHLVMDYVSAASPGRSASYQGQLSSAHVRIGSGEKLNLLAAVDAAFTLDEKRVQFSRLHLAEGHSRADLTGAFSNLRAPVGKFSVKAMATAPDLAEWLALPGKPKGSANFTGELTLAFGGKFDYALQGNVNAKEFGYSLDRVDVNGTALTATLKVTPGQALIDAVSGEAMGGEFTGKAVFDTPAKGQTQTFHADGNFRGMEIRSVARTFTNTAVPWGGLAGGVFSADATLGSSDAKVRVSAAISPNTLTPTGGVQPIEGQIDLRYDQSAGTLSFGDSRVNTKASNIELSGTLGQLLNVRAKTTSLDELRPVLAMMGSNAPKTFPLELRGEASANGTVTGALSDLQFRGEANIRAAAVQGHLLDQMSGEVQANQRRIQVNNLNLTRGAAQITGKLAVTANAGDFSNAELNANLDASNIQIGEVLQEFAGTKIASGMASGNAQISGSVKQPEAEFTLNASKLTAYGENVNHLRARVHYTAQALEVRESLAEFGAGTVELAGTFAHPENIWTDGELRGHASVKNLTAQTVAAWREAQPEADAKLDGTVEFDGRLTGNKIAWRTLNGAGSAKTITFRQSPLGELNWSANTAQNVLNIQTNAKLREAEVKGQGQWRLAEKNMPGSGTLRFSRINVATLHELLVLASPAEKAPAAPPFDGYVEGNATVALELATPRDFSVALDIDALEFHPKSTQALRLDVPPQDIQLRNNGPIGLTITSKEARVRTARFTARETNLEVAGLLPFTGNSGADFNVKGNVNLAILQLLNPDLLARGAAQVTATVRGSLADPSVNGRMELMNASLYLADVPNGVDKANGVVTFDRNRATIEKLTAETGGGQIAIKGSLEFGKALVYRLSGEAKQVRVRYPEDVSLTASAQLALNGTSDNSVLTGTLTLNRAAVTQGADLGRVLANASAPSPSAPDANEYLRGMRLDVHVESAPTFQLETSLTRDIQTEVDLRLRGTILAPALLGTVSASSGEVQMFGNRYTVNRGDVRFLNPVKIEPVLDLDLETRARGIVVSVTVSGSPQKLNVNYSSDPPLQSREIIALLAVGRDPTALTQSSQLEASASSSGFGDAGGLLGQAVSEQLSNRLQRFFGSSRVKIDPTVTGVDTLPSARLTLEQQVSRDVTLTYTTNLNRTQEQIVRLQWDLNPQWSAVAVRDANGLFGVDFQYRKRFK